VAETKSEKIEEQKYEHTFEILIENKPGALQLLHACVLKPLVPDYETQRHAANEIKQKLLEFKRLLHYYNATKWHDPRINRWIQDMYTCRPAAKQAWFYPPPIPPNKRQRKVLKFTCQNKLCPQCHYRRIHKCYTRFKRETKGEELWTGVAWTRIDPRKEYPNDVRAKITRWSRKFRDKLNDTYGLTKGIKVVRLKPPAKMDTDGNLLPDMKTPWELRLGACMVAPPGKLTTPYPNEFDLGLDGDWAYNCQRYTTSQGAKDALVALFEYSPLTLKPPFLWQIPWWFDVMEGVNEIGWMGFPDEVEKCNKK
jgi:hypothetical protein